MFTRQLRGEIRGTPSSEQVIVPTLSQRARQGWGHPRIKIKIKTKGSGRECPLHTPAPPARIPTSGNIGQKWGTRESKIKIKKLGGCGA